MALFLYIILVITIFHVYGVHDSLNFVLASRSRQCFYEDFDSNSPAKTLEAFVQSGGSLDVKVVVHGPLELDELRTEKFERQIINERLDSNREYESDTQTFQMQLKPSVPGTYAICIDNRHSMFTPKLVQVDLRLTPRQKPIVVKTGKTDSESEVDMSEVKAKEALDRLFKGIHKVMVMQQRDRHRLSLHSETNIIDHNKVVSGSIVETAVFIAAAVFQIFFVRRWFGSRNLPGAKQRA